MIGTSRRAKAPSLSSDNKAAGSIWYYDSVRRDAASRYLPPLYAPVS